MSDLVIEVDEAMKQERIEKLWQKYGGFLIGFIAMIILGTASVEGYKAWKDTQNIKQTNLYLDATQKNKKSPAEIMAVAPELQDNLRSLAELHAAGMAMEQDDRTKALEIYKKIEADNNIDPLAAYIAKYMVTNLDQDLTMDQKRSRYKSLTTDQNNPWRFHAHFELAVLEANKAQNYVAARQNLKVILDTSMVAESLKQKAKSLDILYAAKESSKK